MDSKKILVVNQAVNYLTVDIANAFTEKFDEVALLTGSIHEQGESLKESVKVTKIYTYNGSSSKTKIISWIIGSIQIFFRLLFGFRGYKVFFISNPPMAYLMMILIPKKFSLLIWDIYPDALENMGISKSNIVYRLWAKGNKLVFKKAINVFTIGVRMKDVLSKYVERSHIDIIPLWTTFKAFKKVPKEDNYFIDKYNLQNKFIVQYSGNIGYTHDVRILVDVAIKLKDNPDILFMIIGKGDRLENIKKKIKKNKLKNCLILPFQDDDVFPYSLSSADLGVAIVEGKGTTSGNVPSKIYNLMAVGIPILYISSHESELYDYAIQYENGLLFEGKEVEKMARFVENFSTDIAMQEKMARNSLEASKNFTKRNAALLAEKVIA